MESSGEALPGLQANLENYYFDDADESTNTCEGFRQISKSPFPRNVGVIPLMDGVAVVYTSIDYNCLASYRFVIPGNKGGIRYRREVLSSVHYDYEDLPEPVELSGEEAILDDSKASQELEFVAGAIAKAVNNGGISLADPRRLKFERGFEYC